MKVVIFCLSNGVLGVLVVLVARHVGDRPVSLHRVDDITLYIVSLLQAVAFHAWRIGTDQHGGPRRPPNPEVNPGP